MRGFVIFAIGAVAVYFVMREEFWMGSRLAGFSASPDPAMLTQLGINAAVFFGGVFLALLPLILFSSFRDIVFALLALVGFAIILIPGVGTFVSIISAVVGVLVGTSILAYLTFRPGKRPTTFGSAEWATAEDVQAAGLTTGQGFFLGAFGLDANPEAKLHYASDRHLLTVAPTRAGKGTTAIIPNLLSYEGSALVIDPKGENALITGDARERMGQSIMLLDPWDLASGQLGKTAARFNPLDWLVAGDPDLAENAMLLADALVVAAKGGDNRFWDEEAKGLIFSLLLYLATDDREEDRTLGRLRDLLTLAPGSVEDIDDPDSFTMIDLLARMAMSDHPLVVAGGNRLAQKADRERAGVISSAQAQTHFLDSPRIRESLSASDFKFEDLKAGKLTVYLILPADRLNAFGRWLRLMVQQAITVNARNIGHKPSKPVLFMLDEMAALGHLSMIEQAYGLMAGFGIQLWGIVQDLSQLKRIYGDGWETFIGNSGVLQYFGSRDQMTAEYFSKLCGVTTVTSFGESISRAISSGAGGSSSSETTGTSTSSAQRNLAYPDELMTLPGNRQLLLVENHNPIPATKIPWFEDPALRKKGRNLRGAGQSSAAASPIGKGWGAIN
ncbi:MAG: type IV secretory system conjugative DNA transfer family protein [Parvularcula sp.]|jgi:type IV secretion system protein VirD4|nr:type IV secretory system conjugative DNA transfer family protein [Parvularcula sp.]